jgi:hypothetical protein
MDKSLLTKDYMTSKQLIYVVIILIKVTCFDQRRSYSGRQNHKGIVYSCININAAVSSHCLS